MRTRLLTTAMKNSQTNPGRGSDVSRRQVGPAADAPSSRALPGEGCIQEQALFAVVLGLIIGTIICLCIGCSSYTRAEYLNVDGDVYQYAQVINGTRLDLGNGFELDLGMGEYFSMDDTKPREVISVGGSFDYGRLSIYASTDVIGPWDVNPEVSLYTSMELTY